MNANISDLFFEVNDHAVYVFKTGRWRQNSYLIFNMKNSEGYLIDPGGDAPRIIEAVKKLNCNPKAIFLTHAHHDHVGALKEVCEEFRLSFYIHQNDFKLLRRAPLFSLSFEARKMEVPQIGQIFLSSIPQGDIYNEVKFIHTPGHTTGGVVIYFDGLAFTGDTLLNKMVGRTDLPGASINELEASITNFLNNLPAQTVLFPGHGQPWVLEEAKAWWELNKENTPEYRTEDNELAY